MKIPITFFDGAIRLWTGENKESINIGIHINKSIPTDEIKHLYESIKLLLELHCSGKSIR